MNQRKITIVFLDVGQGDSTVILLPDGSSAIVVDCPATRGDVTTSYLENRGINILHVFLTHTDSDHANGLATLIENFGQVATLAYNHDSLSLDHGARRRRTLLRHLGQLIDRRGIQTSSPRTGHHWLFQGVTVEVIHPDDANLKVGVPNAAINDVSVVLRITFANRRVLLTADVQGLAWYWITSRNTDLEADVLKFPHHGAWYSNTGSQPSVIDVLARVNPRLVILSVGTSNPYGHPAQETLKLLRTHSPHLRFLCTEATSQCHSILRTAANASLSCAGSVEVTISQDGITVVPDIPTHARIIANFDSPKCT